MGRVTYNQSGYVGSSMSENAARAYENGEMPKSKWTKKAMISAIREFCDDNDLFYDSDIEKLTKGELWHRFIKWSSWHHTGKYANETDFYSLDEDELLNAFRPMTEAELQQKEEQKEAERSAERQRLVALQERWAEEKRIQAAYEAKKGFPPDCVAALRDAHPELVSERTSRQGTRLLVYETPFGRHECVAARAEKTTVWGGFDATGQRSRTEWAGFLESNQAGGESQKENQSGETGNSLKDAAKEMQAAAKPRDAFAGKNDDVRRIQNRRAESER